MTRMSSFYSVVERWNKKVALLIRENYLFHTATLLHFPLTVKVSEFQETKSLKLNLGSFMVLRRKSNLLLSEQS